jgi:hypothetical protein
MTYSLTREDIAALRAADSYSFHHHRSADDGPHMMIAYLHSYGQRIYTAREQRLFPSPHANTDRMRAIPVESAAQGYADGGETTWFSGRDGEQTARAFATIGGHSSTMRTIMGLLRVDDRVVLQWRADNNTDNIRAVGFHADELRLNLIGPGKRDLMFLVTTSVGPDNSARMIRRHG